MIRRNLLVGSVLLILGLLSAVSYRVRLLQGGKPTLLEQPSIAPQDTGLEPNPAAAGRVEAPARTSFTARGAESFDYRDSIARLRASGCSEKTICEIIGAELSKRYHTRKLALYPGAEELFHHWHTAAEHPRIVPEQISEWEAKCAELEKEKSSVLTDLLGEDCTAPELLTVEQVDADRRLAFLPEAKPPLLRAIVEKYPELEEQVEAIVNRGSTTAADPQELNQVLQRYAGKKAELAQLLSPAEYEQYELNNSWTARNVRNGLAGFNPTEAEFREIFKIWRAQDESLVTIYATGQPDPGVTGVNNAIHELLGDDRFQQYQNTWRNPELHELAQLAEDYQLPAETPAWVDSLKQNALMQQKQLLADGLLTEEQRQASLQALQAQTEEFISQQLGATAYEQYLSGIGAWVRQFSIPQSPAPH